MTPRRLSLGAAAESSFPLCRAFAIIWYEIVTMLGLVGGLLLTCRLAYKSSRKPRTLRFF